MKICWNSNTVSFFLWQNLRWNQGIRKGTWLICRKASCILQLNGISLLISYQTAIAPRKCLADRSEIKFFCIHEKRRKKINAIDNNNANSNNVKNCANKNELVLNWCEKRILRFINVGEDWTENTRMERIKFIIRIRCEWNGWKRQWLNSGNS